MTRKEAIELLEKYRNEADQERKALEAALAAAQEDLRKSKESQSRLIALPNREEEFAEAVVSEAKAEARIKYASERLKVLDKHMTMPDAVFNAATDVIVSEAKEAYIKKLEELREALQKPLKIAVEAHALTDEANGLIDTYAQTVHCSGKAIAHVDGLATQSFATSLKAKVASLDLTLEALKR